MSNEKIRLESLLTAEGIVSTEGLTLSEIACRIDRAMDRCLDSENEEGLYTNLITRIEQTIKIYFKKHGFIHTGSLMGDLEMLDCRITEFRRQIQSLRDRTALSRGEEFERIKERVDEIIEQYKYVKTGSILGDINVIELHLRS